jgi:O-Glycosyl hydrolase
VKKTIDKPLYVALDSSRVRQRFEGWGTSLCWWGNVIGKWWNDAKINEIADLLFSDAQGLGINIIRYNIGGGENPPTVKKNFRIGADIPCYQPQPGIWDWSADAGQRKLLFKARDRGANIFETFSNTPPVWMTKNNCTAGAMDRWNNLKDDHYGIFAEFIAEVVKHFQDKWGISFRTLSLFNEPISCWWHSNNDQEGCFFDTNKQNEIILETAKKLEVKRLIKTTFAAPDGWSVFDTIYAYGCYTDIVKSKISQINTHAYSGDKKSRLWLKSIAERDQKRLWMSEVAIGGTQSHNHNDMSGALELSQSIYDYLTEMNAIAWVYWQVVEDEAGNHNYGLIHANFSGPEEYWVTKQYYAFAQFSKFIKPGSQIINCQIENCIVALNKTEDSLVIIVFNPKEEGREYIFDLSSFNNLGSFATLYRTSATENLMKLNPELIINQKLKLNISVESITTCLISVI